MPDAELVAYYDAMTPKLLPFLRGRRVAVRHHYNHAPVFRRHLPNGRWIRVADADQLHDIVRQHGYELFPHLEGENDLWFALDIDVRSVPLRLGSAVVRTVLDVLDERGVRYLLTFSGHNGFHVRWAFARHAVPRAKWLFLRAIVRALRDETERRLHRSAVRKELYQHLPRTDPMTELSAADKKAQHSILFDELILKPQATIRAPFSVHMKRRLVAIPLNPERLTTFEPTRDATMTAGKKHAVVRLPKNPVAPFLKAPWT